MVVTGAAQGIGRGVALRAAAEGAKVLFVDRADFVSEVAAEAHGADTAGFVADLETYEGAASAMAFAARKFGGIDILVNGVGGAIRMRPFAEFEPAQIDAEIRRSLMPTLYACHAVLAAHARTRRRDHRQRVLERHTRHSPRAVFGGEGRRQRDDAVAGDGIRRAQHPRGRCRAGWNRGACRDACRATLPAIASRKKPGWAKR